MNTPNPTADELFNFPCDYPIKVMGLDCPEFKKTICHIIEAHTGALQPQQITDKKSTKGKYISYTISVVIQSRQQIDALNQDLQNCELVAYIL